MRVFLEKGGDMQFSRRDFLRIAGITGLSLAARADAPAHFSVAAINDMHLSDAASGRLLAKAIEKINAMPEVKFTAVLGDLSANDMPGELELAKELLSKLAQPYEALPGNHDVAKGYADYGRVFQADQWWRSEADWYFIGLDTCEGGSSDVTVPADRVQWIKNLLEKIPPGAPLGLFSHHPFNPHTKKYRIKNADEVLGLFANRKLRLVASGHWHGNQVETVGDVLFTTTACCSTTRENFDKTAEKGFRVFHIDGLTVKTEFVAVG
jgi:3',5'-cyclic AMP phosphodiesterase CpdA